MENEKSKDTTGTEDLMESLRSEADVFSGHLENLLLGYGESFYNELPPNQTELAFRWAEKWRANPAQIAALIFTHRDNSDPIIRFGLAGYWLMKHTPEEREGDGKEGQDD